MDAAHDNRRQLGRLMVDEGFLAEEQLAIALEEQSRTGRPLGTILVELGFVSAGAVSNALAEQHGGLLKTEFGVSAGLHALPGGATRQTAAAAADPVGARTRELETQLQAVLRERNALAQRVNEQAVRLSEAGQVQAAEVARVTDAAAAHIAGLEAEFRSGLAARDELVSALQQELAELREHAGQQQEPETSEAHAAEVARVTDAAAAHIAGLEAKLSAAVDSREETEAAVRQGAARIADLEQEVTALRAEAERLQNEPTAEAAPVEQAHVLFIPSSGGYRLLERPGPAPASGTTLDVDGLDFVVGRIGASPLPRSRLRCVFLERV